MVFFTLCSNNYLAHAKSLGDSLLRHNPAACFLIGLVDQMDSSIDYEKEIGHELVSYDSIGFHCLDEMLSYYNIIEFNTAVKPYYFEYLFRRFGPASRILYLDPDIFVYKSLQSLFSLFDVHEILLTPNLISAPEEVDSGELVSLRHGMFNLGFIGIRPTEESMRFVRWWQKRLLKHCVIRKNQGLFVDQKWVDLAPLFFSGIHVVRDPGFNMAWWNLVERKLLQNQDGYYVNDFSKPLHFFHFSGYVPGSNQFTGRNDKSNVYSFELHPELNELFNDYADQLMLNGYKKISTLQPLPKFKPLKNKYEFLSFTGFVQNLLKKISRGR